MVKKNTEKKFIVAGFNLPSSIPTKIKNEILEIIKDAKFDKLSYSLSTYRKLIDKQIDDDDERINTVGFIKDFNPETNTFKVGIFAGSRDIIEEFVNPIITPLYNTVNKGNNLGVITKLIIEPGPTIVSDESDDTVEDTIWSEDRAEGIDIPDEVKNAIGEE